MNIKFSATGKYNNIESYCSGQVKHIPPYINIYEKQIWNFHLENIFKIDVL